MSVLQKLRSWIDRTLADRLPPELGGVAEGKPATAPRAEKGFMAIWNPTIETRGRSVTASAVDADKAVVMLAGKVEGRLALPAGTVDVTKWEGLFANAPVREGALWPYRSFETADDDIRIPATITVVDRTSETH